MLEAALKAAAWFTLGAFSLLMAQACLAGIAVRRFFGGR